MHVRVSSLSQLSTLFVTALALSACGGAEQPTQEVTEWLGELTHLAVSGTYQGMTFDVRLEGDAAEAAGVTCTRVYAPLPGTEPDAAGNYDTSQVYFAMKELGGDIELEGEIKHFTISYWRHDLPAGSEMEVIARQFGSSIPEGQTWSDINVFEPGADELSGIESAALSGSVSLMLNSGEPDSGGVMVPTGGRTGEFVSASWGPNDNLNISATADCITTPIVTWPQTRILP